MEIPRQLTAGQVTAVLISAVIGVGVLPLPLIVVQAADTGAPLSTLIGIIAYMCALAVVVKLGMRFPRESFVQYNKRILGKWLGSIGSVFVILFTLVFLALSAREFGEVVIETTLRQTPIEVTVIVMLLLAALFSRMDINTFAYIHTFYLPGLVAPVITIAVLAFNNAEFLYLQPVWGNDPSGMLSGSLRTASLLQISFVVTILIPYMRTPKQALKASMGGLLIAGVVYLFIICSVVAMFGPEEVRNMLWPTLELARATALPGNVMERLDVIFLVVWVLAVFTSIYAGYTLVVRVLNQLVQLRDHKLLSFFILPIVFFIAMLPKNLLQMYQFIENVGNGGLLLTAVYPLILYALAHLRKVKGKEGTG